GYPTRLHLGARQPDPDRALPPTVVAGRDGTELLDQRHRLAQVDGRALAVPQLEVAQPAQHQELDELVGLLVGGVLGPGDPSRDPGAVDISGRGPAVADARAPSPASPHERRL